MSDWKTASTHVVVRQVRKCNLHTVDVLLKTSLSVDLLRLMPGNLWYD